MVFKCCVKGCTSTTKKSHCNRTLSEVESYITGYICKRILKIIGVCKECRQILVTSDEDIEEHKLIKFRDYTKHSLIRPRNKFATLFNLCYQVAYFYMPNLVNNVNDSLLNLLYQRINLNIPQCQNNHDFVGMFYKHFAVLFVQDYSK
jgi:hypothetical protein